MTALNFKLRFVEAILSGEKRQTIRRVGKRPEPQHGAELQLYTGMRTRQCRKIADAVCVRCLPISIDAEARIIVIGHNDGGAFLSPTGAQKLAQADGFGSAKEMFDFFKATYGCPQIDAWVIEWDRVRPTHSDKEAAT